MSSLLTELPGLIMKLYMMVVLCGISHVSGMNLSSTVKQTSGVKSACVGDNVTLQCFYDSNVAMHFSWYQQTLGGKPQLLSTIYKYDERTTQYFHVKKNSRFLVQYEQGINHLHITDIEPSDSATYYCGSAHSNVVEFGEGVFVSVKESSPSKIVQLPLVELVQPGESVTLNCTVLNLTCDGGHVSVYWLRHGPHPVIIHADGIKDQCGETSKTSCVYHLQRKVLNWTDAGMYYCAVASCGEILFGNGSKVDIATTLPQIHTFVILSISRCGIMLLFIAICTFVYFVKMRPLK